MPEVDDEHYIRHVSDLGRKTPVVAHEPIYSRSGIRLVDRGAPITEALFEKLVAHKLRAPIDQCVNVARTVSLDSLRSDLEALLERFEPARCGSYAALLSPLDGFPLAAPLAVKLPVMREQRPEMYKHSLQVGLIALLMAAAAEFDSAQLRKVLAASLFHDIGLMHIDPRFLEERGRLEDRQLRQLDSHPITGQLILKGFPEWQDDVANAVLEHHERIDGSGYPRRARGAELGSLGQLIAVAEFGAAILWTRRKPPYQVSVALRFNEEKLNPVYAKTLIELFWKSDKQHAKHDEAAALTPHAAFSRIRSALEEVNSIRLRLACEAASQPLISLLERRMHLLRRNLARTGIDLERVDPCISEREADTGLLAELRCISTEATWQLRAITLEVRRRIRDRPIECATTREVLLRWADRYEHPEPPRE